MHQRVLSTQAGVVLRDCEPACIMHQKFHKAMPISRIYAFHAVLLVCEG